MIFEEKKTYNLQNYYYNGLIIPMEIWKPITEEMVPNVKPVYYISNIGNIYNAERQLYFFIDINKCKRYVPVTLTLKDRSQVHIHLHILVCKAFHGIPEKDMTVDHLDFDKTCNCENNLEWVTAEENYRRAYDAGRMTGRR